MRLETLTLISTLFIVLSGASLLIGWWLIRRGKITAHRNMMLSATAFAGLFLVAYVTRWAIFGSKTFEGTGLWRSVYLGILAPHIILSLLVGPAALLLIDLALRRKDFVRHRALARWVLPVWLFVAVSGWAIYFMLYHVQY
jgi:putative membrane protein